MFSLWYVKTGEINFLSLQVQALQVSQYLILHFSCYFPKGLFPFLVGECFQWAALVPFPAWGGGLHIAEA